MFIAHATAQYTVCHWCKRCAHDVRRSEPSAAAMAAATHQQLTWCGGTKDKCTTPRASTQAGEDATTGVCAKVSTSVLGCPAHLAPLLLQVCQLSRQHRHLLIGQLQLQLQGLNG